MRNCGLSWTSTGIKWSNGQDLDQPYPGLSLRHQPIPRQPLPLLSQLLQLCRNRNSTPRLDQGRVAHAAASRALSSLARRWLRPRPRPPFPAPALVSMENIRLILFVALSVVVLLLWQAWQADQHPKPAPTATAAPAGVPAPVAQAPATPSAVPAPASGAAQTPTAQSVPDEQQGLTQGQRIRVITDVLVAEIDTVGGDVRQVDLPAFPVSVNQPEQPYRLLNDSTAHIFVAQSGLLSSSAAPDHHAHYTADQTEYRLADGAIELLVPLRWTDEHGVTVTKLYTFHRGGYVVDVAQALSNQGAEEWKGRFYRQFQRSRVERESAFIYTYTGGVISSENNKYQKVSFDDMDKGEINQEIKGGWAAMIQHYFLAAWIPPQDQIEQFYSKALGGGRYVLGMVTPVTTVAPGASTTFSSKLYVGTKLQD